MAKNYAKNLTAGMKVTTKALTNLANALQGAQKSTAGGHGAGKYLCADLLKDISQHATNVQVNNDAYLLCAFHAALRGELPGSDCNLSLTLQAQETKALKDAIAEFLSRCLPK